DGMFRVGHLCFFLDDLVLAVWSAVAAAEQLEEVVNRRGVARADGPVQPDDSAAACGQLCERLLPLRIICDPLCALGEKEIRAIAAAQQLRPLAPATIYLQCGDLQTGNVGEALAEDAQARHVLVCLDRMPVGALAEEQQLLLRRVGHDERSLEPQRDEQQQSP